MQARFSILRTFLAAGKEFCRLDYEREDLEDLTIFLDREKILTHGRPAVEKYLQTLHVLKCTGDVEAGTRMYNEITNVEDFFAEKVRPVVLRKKVPRKVFVQASTILVDGPDGRKHVSLRGYEPTASGMIRSYAERTYI